MTETIREQAERMAEYILTCENVYQPDYIEAEIMRRMAGTSFEAAPHEQTCPDHDIPLVEHHGKLICTICSAYPYKENE